MAAMRSSEDLRLQEQADQVLLAHRPALDELGLAGVVQQAFEPSSPMGRRQVTAGTPAQDDAPMWRVEVLPLFLMAQDQRSLSASVVLRIWPEASRPNDAPLAERTVLVVSNPVQAQDAQSHWQQSNALALRRVLSGLLAEAVELAARPEVDPTGPQRTVRYLEGNREKAERAQVIETRCARTLMRNLRGWLLSVPVERETPTSPPECAERDLRFE